MRSFVCWNPYSLFPWDLFTTYASCNVLIFHKQYDMYLSSLSNNYSQVFKTKLENALKKRLYFSDKIISSNGKMNLNTLRAVLTLPLSIQIQKWKFESKFCHKILLQKQWMAEWSLDDYFQRCQGQPMQMWVII